MSLLRGEGEGRHLRVIDGVLFWRKQIKKINKPNLRRWNIFKLIPVTEDKIF